MERTQIYLSVGQTRELDRRARQRGITRSALIREAVASYLGPSWDSDAFIAALNEFSGIWADRNDLDEVYADLTRRSRDSLAQLLGDRLAEVGDDGAERT